MPASERGAARYLDPAPRPALGPSVLAGIALLAAGAGGFVAWAGLSPLASGAVAPGVVVVESHRKTVQHLEGGIIDTILVDEGATIAAGQVLIRLDDARAKATYDLVQGQLQSTLALEARLIAERDGRGEIEIPPELAAVDGDSETGAIMAAQRRLFEARRRAREGQVSILRQRILQFREEIGGLKAQQRSKERQIALIGEEYKGVKELYDKGIERRPRLLALERAQAVLEGERGELVAQMSRAAQAIGEAELRIIDIDNAFQQEVATQLRENQVRLAELRERLRAQDDIIARLDIRAPQAGIVVNLRFHTPRGVIPAGAPVLDIVPGADRLTVEARVQPEDVDAVHVGLPAEVRLTAFQRRTTPSVMGRVVHVSADRLVEERSGLPFYRARIELDPASLAALGPNLRLAPGMPAEVMIETGTRLAIDYLLAPLTASLGRAFREE